MFVALNVNAPVESSHENVAFAAPSRALLDADFEIATSECVVPAAPALPLAATTATALVANAVDSAAASTIRRRARSRVANIRCPPHPVPVRTSRFHGQGYVQGEAAAMQTVTVG